MKRFFAIALALSVFVSGCGVKDTATGDRTSVVCTIFPQYDWTKQIIGDSNIDVTLLLNSGIDLHSYQPSVTDIVKISSCDMFIYTGGESDKWVKDALESATNKNMIVVNLLDVLGDLVKTEELVEGMEHDEHGHAHEDEHEEYDEHVWLSLRNTQVLCGYIAEKLGEIDPDSRDLYKSNATEYNSRLRDLDSNYSEAVADAPIKTLLFGDRFPFRYLMDDYGMEYYAAFPGCSAETEASFETVIFLAKKADDLGLHSIMVTESADMSIAKTIISNTQSKNQQILVLDAMQSVTSADAEGGTSYISIMERNLNVLKQALTKET